MNASFYRSQIKCHARIAGGIYGKFDLILVASTFVHYQGEVCSYPDVSADADYVVSMQIKIPGRKEVQEPRVRKRTKIFVGFSSIHISGFGLNEALCHSGTVVFSLL